MSLCLSLLLFSFTNLISSFTENNMLDPDYITPTHIVIYQGGINQSFDPTKNNFNEYYYPRNKTEYSDEGRSWSEKWSVIKYLWLVYNNWKPFTIGFLIGAYKDQIIKCAALSSIGFFLFCKKTYKTLKAEGVRSGLSCIAKVFI
jgi:hypothetical protein